MYNYEYYRFCIFVYFRLTNRPSSHVHEIGMLSIEYTFHIGTSALKIENRNT